MLSLVLPTLATATPDAEASCGGQTYTWSLEAIPARAEEGANVIVTVGLEGGTAETTDDQENISIETVDGEARAGRDYTGIPKTVVTLRPGNSKDFTIPITKDSVTEPEETFRVRLVESHPCATNVYFIQAPVTVWIVADRAGDEAVPNDDPASQPNIAATVSREKDNTATRKSASTPQATRTPDTLTAADSPAASSEGSVGVEASPRSTTVAIIVAIAIVLAAAAWFLVSRLRRS